MRISAKTRYGLSAILDMCKSCRLGDSVTVIRLAERLKISKIYLEQVFSLLKRAGIVTSIKGAQGGYQLARPPKDITAYDIFAAIESNLFEKAEETVAESAPNMERVMKKVVFDSIDECIVQKLSSITMEDLLIEMASYDSDSGYMYYL